MKKLTATVTFLLAFCFLHAGCRSSTEYGECVGIQDSYEAQLKHPDLEYKLSVRNTVLGVIFFQTIFAPIIWLAADFKCPVAKRGN